MRLPLLLGILAGSVAQAATPAPLFQQDCDTLPLGEYPLERLLADFRTTSGSGFLRKGEGENRVAVMPAGEGGKGRALRVKFPRGGYDSDPSGAQWKTDLRGAYDELYLSYRVKFEPGFELDKIGKLPGFGGGVDFEDRSDATEWSAKLMWRDAIPEFYLHSPTLSDKKFPWIAAGTPVRFRIGVWHRITLRYRMNEVGRANGHMEAWLDGEPVGLYRDISFRNNSRVGITQFFFSTFFGGNERDAPTADNYAWFDEFVVWQGSQSPLSGLPHRISGPQLHREVLPVGPIRVYRGFAWLLSGRRMERPGR